MQLTPTGIFRLHVLGLGRSKSKSIGREIWSVWLRASKVIAHPLSSVLLRPYPQRSFLLLSCSSSRSFSSTTPTQGQRKKRMPPKKAAAAEKKTLLGRPSNNLKIGIVGLFCFQSSKWSDLTFPFCLTFRIAQCWQVVLLQCLVQDRYEKKLFSRRK